ncbi:MAG: bifunctional folylpolyglutamate synthase/dihydrofolate synthase [Gemmatimonadetes bacterium]|nr:bifunctional folylpolyglutamate synthase/dihydrofolate synthase [Gemmatimonadota bacterium]
MGRPERAFASVHVGGTNGKGSVSALVASALRAAGHRVGLYTSPHLVRFEERIQVDGRPLATDLLQSVAGRLAPAVDAFDPAFFEAATALAFTAFREEGVEIAVVEVGLGGRLDATNVLEPLIAGVTNVGLDHAEFLGDTHASVAREKAGIAKPDVPFLTTEADPSVRAVLMERARALGARTLAVDASELGDLRWTGRGLDARVERSGWGALDVWTPLPGAHQALNLLLAVRLLDLLPERWRPDRDALQQGLARTVWPGRLDLRTVRGRPWLFDVAHNAEGIEALARALPTFGLPRPTLALVGILGDKPWRSMLERLGPLVDRALLVEPPSAPASRRWVPRDVEAWRGRADLPGVVWGGDLAAMLDAVGPDVASVLVTGSAHTVGDAFGLLGIEPWPVAAEADDPDAV